MHRFLKSARADIQPQACKLRDVNLLVPLGFETIDLLDQLSLPLQTIAHNHFFSESQKLSSTK
jgi:hypothetical protein